MPGQRERWKLRQDGFFVPLPERMASYPPPEEQELPVLTTEEWVREYGTAWRPPWHYRHRLMDSLNELVRCDGRSPNPR